MDTLRINILNPKARSLLNDLADMQMIEIRESPDNKFAAVLEKLRSKKAALSPDEIAKEVEMVRAKRYAK